jgi:hypothetical protein
MGTREDRLARNEALFRAVNERVKEARRPAEGETIVFICECGDENCTAEISLTLSEYEGVRSDPLQFVLAHGHANPSIEEVVEHTDRYEVGRKHAEEARIARETDPRSGG